MRSLQTAAYFGKKLGTSGVGRAVNYAAKYTAGCYFDLCCSHYHAEGLTFEIPKKHTTRAMRGRFAVDTYELPERELIRKYLSPEAQILELGGCIGVVSCMSNSLLRNPHAHLVVEANPFLIPFLQGNRDRNGARFSVAQCIVCRAPQATLGIAANMDGSRVNAEGMAVPTRTFESLEDTYHLKFDTLVMDIEGAESTFLKENKASLRQFNLVVVEFHPDVLGEAEVSLLREILVDAGLEKVDQRLTTEVYRRP